MEKALVAYFSATGTTEKVAEGLADAIGADPVKIEPEVPYTAADLNWNDPDSRSSREMKDPASRPKIKNTSDAITNDFDTLFVGFPIWWYVAPTIVNTFLESLDLKGKTVVPFATSGGSGMGKTAEKLAPSCPEAEVKRGRRFDVHTDKEELKRWAESQ